MSINARLRNNVARLIGQSNGITKMYESGRRCADILVQLSAIASSINTCTKKIFDYHIDECLRGSACQADEIAELRLMLHSINEGKIEGSMSDVIDALENGMSRTACVDILRQFRRAYAIVIYNAGELFSRHLSHVILTDSDASASEELKEMTALYFKMLK